MSYYENLKENDWWYVYLGNRDRLLQTKQQSKVSLSIAAASVDS